MQLSISDQLEAFSGAAGKELVILRGAEPGRRSDRTEGLVQGVYVVFGVRQTKNPEEAMKLVDWLMNSPESANINLAERGIPANTEMLALVKPKLSRAPQQATAEFITDIKPELSGCGADRPATRRWHPGGRGHAAPPTDVLFERTEHRRCQRPSSWTRSSRT